MTQRPSISVVLADDHPVVLHGIVSLLGAHSDLKIVAGCSDGSAAAEAIRKYSPDVAVLDLAMPGLNGLDILSAVAAERAATKIVFLTATVTEKQILTAIACGAEGVMLKDAAPNDLIRCVRDVAAGRRWYPAEIVHAALERQTERAPQGELIDEGLTPREREVVKLVSGGLSNKEVGRRLGLSEGTIKIHLHNIYGKLGVSNRTGLTALAITHRVQLNF